jgi:flavin reductase (DIM6/NTAB) family NADH-FMN oxidoreductase RutF
VTGSDAFEQIMATVDAPMVIVTARTVETTAGCLVGFSTQCSIEPRRYLVCLSKSNRSSRVAASASTLAVHVLHDDPHDRALASLFGEETGRELDKFEHCAWHHGPGDTVVLDGCDWFAGDIVERVDLGDHVGFVLDVTQHGAATRTAEQYLGYVDVKGLDAGNPA